ncbi:MAG: hypothetical protein HY720_06465, partial [Planctomycetes bacterium]|nr:hypothetical protein [Planctomycetota bacterium]
MRLPGSLTVRRFRVEGSAPAAAEAMKLLAKRVRPPGEEFVPAQGEARGWSAFDNLLDVEPDAGRWVEAGRLFFALRVGRRRAPAALVKAKAALQERARREEMGLAVLPSKIRQEIREEVKK